MHTRRCPRCDQELLARQHLGEGGLTLLWQCTCGWAGARTVSQGEDVRAVRSKSGTAPRVHIELTTQQRKVR